MRSPAEIYGLMQRGGAIRATGETKMNEMSSRSHAVFIVIVEQSETLYLDNQGTEITIEEFNKLMQSKGRFILRLDRMIFLIHMLFIYIYCMYVYISRYKIQGARC